MSEFLYAIHEVFHSLQVPYVPILGNHDIWPYAGSSEAHIPDNCLLGEFFYKSFGDRWGYYNPQYDIFYKDSLHFANWKTAREFCSSPNNYSYYLNLSFNHQNYRFIGADFNSRNDAPYPWLGALGEGDVNSWSLNWIDAMVDSATNEGRKLFILCHYPLIEGEEWWPWWMLPFTEHEIHQISDAGLKNNKPPAHWIGGHIHGGSWPRIDTTYYGRDTVVIALTLNNASKDGVYGFVRIYDKGKASIVHYPSDFPLPVTVEFQAIYSHLGGDYAPSSYSQILTQFC